MLAGAWAASALKAAIVLLPDAALYDVSMSVINGQNSTYALMAPTIPPWQCFAWEQ